MDSNHRSSGCKPDVLDQLNDIPKWTSYHTLPSLIKKFAVSFMYGFQCMGYMSRFELGTTVGQLVMDYTQLFAQIPT